MCASIWIPILVFLGVSRGGMCVHKSECVGYLWVYDFTVFSKKKSMKTKFDTAETAKKYFSLKELF